MGNLFKMDLVRAFINKRIFLTTLLAMVSFIYGYVRVVQYQAGYSISAVNSWQAILMQGNYGFFAALMAALPYADALVQEKNNSFLQQVVLRSNYRDYILSKVWVNLIAGAAVVTVPAVILLGFCTFQFHGQSIEVPNLFWNSSAWMQSQIVLPGSGAAPASGGYLPICLLFLVAFGACYALMGLGISFMVRNPYLAVGLPFVVYCFGYFILTTSVRLQWMGSTSMAILPSGNLFGAVIQYLGMVALFLLSLAVFGNREKQLLH